MAKASANGLMEFQVAPRRCVRDLSGVDQVHPAVIKLPRSEGDTLVASGHLLNARIKEELNATGIDVGLEGKNVGPAVIQGRELPGPDED